MTPSHPDPFPFLSREAEFSYHFLEPDVLAIVDLSLAGNSVTNDAERVLAKIEARHPGTLARCRIMYRDSMGYWDGIKWDGRQVTFFPLRETDEAAAERKLRAR